MGIENAITTPIIKYTLMFTFQCIQTRSLMMVQRLFNNVSNKYAWLHSEERHHVVKYFKCRTMRQKRRDAIPERIHNCKTMQVYYILAERE